jgi:hypothetical protein
MVLVAFAVERATTGILFLLSIAGGEMRSSKIAKVKDSSSKAGWRKIAISLIEVLNRGSGS